MRLPPMASQQELFTQDSRTVRYPVYFVPTVTMPELAPPGGTVTEMFHPVRQDEPLDSWDDASTDHLADSAIATLDECRSDLHDRLAPTSWPDGSSRICGRPPDIRQCRPAQPGCHRPGMKGGAAMARPEQIGGVAWWAHVGGFVAGVAFLRLFVKTWRPLGVDGPAHDVGRIAHGGDWIG
jgi:hypothetical protein